MPGRTQDATVLAAGHVERSGNTSEYRQAALRPAAPEDRRQYQITLAVLLILPLCMVLVVLLDPFAIQDFPSAALAPHMTPSLEIAWKLLPLYFVVAPGIVLGRLFEIGRVSIGTVLVRGASPVVFFCAVASAPVTPHDLLCPRCSSCCPPWSAWPLSASHALCLLSGRRGFPLSSQARRMWAISACLLHWPFCPRVPWALYACPPWVRDLREHRRLLHDGTQRHRHARCAPARREASGHPGRGARPGG